MSLYKMLIVEDEWIISDSLISMNEWNMRNIVIVGTPCNGREAIEILKQEHVDFILTDIRMPEMDGLQLLQYVRENYPHIQVIIMSGYEEFAYAHTALKYSARAYVLKPIDTEELLHAIDDIIAQMPPIEKLPETYRDSIVYQAKGYMQKNLGKPITLNDVADAIHLTPHYFGQMFKEVTGITFLHYLTKIRMEKACELLRDPRLKHYEISNLVGYTDPNYFTKVFQKIHGKTPKDFRMHVGD
jgi:two-component system response regulator YesN